MITIATAIVIMGNDNSEETLEYVIKESLVVSWFILGSFLENVSVFDR